MSSFYHSTPDHCENHIISFKFSFSKVEPKKAKINRRSYRKLVR